MENATLVALSRQIVLKRKLEVIADNVANINTDGFKRKTLAFEESGMPRGRTNLFERRDRMDSFVSEFTALTDFSTGSIEQTGGQYDVALNGDGFFTVQTPAGERYTRAGNFQIDSTGRLVTSDGLPVLGEGGEIVFAPNETGIVFGTDGSVSSSAGQKGRLRLAAFENDVRLTKAGANLFATDRPAQVATAVTVQQGAVERSNVSGVTEITQMIEVSRAYEQIASLMNRQDDLRSRAIERLGQVQA